MAVTWGEPEYANSSLMQGPAQISDVAEFAMLRGVRHFDTQSLLLAATGMVEDYLAVVKAIPGGIFRYTGTAWVMHGTAEFATASARNAAITTPAQGMRAHTTDTGTTWGYYGAYNATTNPYGTSVNATPTAGWYAVGGNVPRVTVRRTTTATTSGTANTFTAVTWDAEEFDTYAAHDNAVNPSRLVAAVAGIYRVAAHLNFTTTASPNVSLRVAKNGAAVGRSTIDQAGTSGWFPQVQLDYTLTLAAGDYVEIQFAASAASINADAATSYASLQYLGAPVGA